MNEFSSLEGKHVVICGGTSGIGQAVAQQALAAGARVTVLGRSAVSEGGTHGTHGIHGIRMDMGKAEEIQHAAAQLAGMAPVHHLVITSGARIPSATLDNLKEEDILLGFQVKLFGSLSLIRALLPVLDESASVTLTSGLLSRKFVAGGLLKSAINAATEASGKVLAKELAPRRVNVISPGVFDTGLWGAAGSDSRNAAMQKTGSALPVGRSGQPQEAAALYLHVMTNRFITGSVLDIDGGGLL